MRFFSIGETYLQIGEYNKALNFFDYLVEKNPDFDIAMVWIKQAQCHLKLHHTDQALNYYERG